MQPNPLNTTNTLLLQLIQISLNGPSGTQLSTLSASTGYSSTNFWTQLLAYASLALSLFAAFGAVLGKQWLGYYKANCYGRGSLKVESRCRQRHRKFQQLQAWQFENVLQSFPSLLQISLFLFGLSLGAAMWGQQQAISMLIIGTTALGSIFHVFIIIVSLVYPDSPFQTPVSLAIQAFFRHFHFRGWESANCQYHDGDSAASAVQWILETSTNPDIILSALEFMPATSKQPDKKPDKQPDIDLVLLCAEVRDMFKACFDHRGFPMLQDKALTYGKSLIYLSWNYPDVRGMLRKSTQGWDLWESWRTLYLPRALEQVFASCGNMMETVNADTCRHYQADTRTALRMVVAAGVDQFTDPNDTSLVWDGQFRSHCSKRDFDRLVGCVEYFYSINDTDVAGDALLLAGDIATASASPDFDSCRRIRLCITSLFNTSHQSQRWRCIVLRTACQVLESDTRHCNDQSFLQVILMTICPPINHTMQKNACDVDYSQLNDTADLLNSTKWPEGSDLALSPLPKIQNLVLRVLSVLPTPKIDDPATYTPYCRAFIHLMSASEDSVTRCSALRFACSARENLAMITATGCDPSFQHMVLSELPPALLATAKDDSNDYLSLVFALAKSPDWHSRLIKDGHVTHVARCIPLIRDAKNYVLAFYLADFFIRIAPPGQPTLSWNAITRTQWWFLISMAWCAIIYHPDVLDDGIEIIPTLVKGTEMCVLQDPSMDDLELLHERLIDALDELRQRNAAESIISEVTGLSYMVQGITAARLVVSNISESVLTQELPSGVGDNIGSGDLVDHLTTSSTASAVLRQPLSTPGPSRPILELRTEPEIDGSIWEQESPVVESGRLELRIRRIPYEE